MNEPEVEECFRMFKNDPVLGPAAMYLRDFRDMINKHSDGWAYWHHGRKCANDLQDMLSKAMDNRWRPERDYVAPTRKDVVRVTNKIANFVKRHEQLQAQGAKAPTLADAVQLTLL